MRKRDRYLLRHIATSQREREWEKISIRGKHRRARHTSTTALTLLIRSRPLRWRLYLENIVHTHLHTYTHYTHKETHMHTHKHTHIHTHTKLYSRWLRENIGATRISQPKCLSENLCIFCPKSRLQYSLLTFWDIWKFQSCITIIKYIYIYMYLFTIYNIYICIYIQYNVNIYIYIYLFTTNLKMPSKFNYSFVHVSNYLLIVSQKRLK